VETGIPRDYFHDFLFLPPTRDGEPPAIIIGTADKSPGGWRRPERARGAMFRSVDGAQSWHRIALEWGEAFRPMPWAFAPHPDDPNAVFVGLGEVNRGPGTGPTGPGSIVLSRDRGDSWEQIANVPGARVLWAAPD
jgi:hypothetical protein